MINGITHKLKNKALTCKRVGAAALVIGACLSGALPHAALASKTDFPTINVTKAQEETPLYIPFGKADMLKLDGDVSDVMVADPKIVSVQAVQANKLYLVGSNIGNTNIITLGADGEVIARYDVHVRFDVEAIQDYINKMFPDEQIKVSAVRTQIYLSGTVSTPDISSKVANIVGAYVSELQAVKGTNDELVVNNLQVRGQQQVMLQVRIIEASRTVLKELGVGSTVNDTSLSGALDIKGNNKFVSSAATGAGIGLNSDPAGTLRVLTDTGLAGIGAFSLTLNALENENLVRVLAEPNLTAISGQQAGFLAGGEFPVPVGRDQTGNIVIEFRQFGVSLNFRPVVMSDKRISLQLNTEVSSLDNTNAIVLADLTVPGLDVRRAETTVEVPSGGSLMIAGLLKSDMTKSLAGLPGIKDTPVLGKLMSSDNFARNETELVVMVTPYLVEPYKNKETAKQVKRAKSRALANAFAANMRRIFGIKEEDHIFSENTPYGYILD